MANVIRIKGQNFRAFIGDDEESMNAIPEETNCQVTISGNMEDASTKDSEGGWTEEQMTSKQWTVSVDDVDATVATLRALITQFNSDTKPTVGWDRTLTTANSQNQTPAGDVLNRYGKAILNDLSIQATNRSTTTVSIQYQGSGALASLT